MPQWIERINRGPFPRRLILCPRGVSRLSDLRRVSVAAIHQLAPALLSDPRIFYHDRGTAGSCTAKKSFPRRVSPLRKAYIQEDLYTLVAPVCSSSLVVAGCLQHPAFSKFLILCNLCSFLRYRFSQLRICRSLPPLPSFPKNCAALQRF